MDAVPGLREGFDKAAKWAVRVAGAILLPAIEVPRHPKRARLRDRALTHEKDPATAVRIVLTYSTSRPWQGKQCLIAVPPWSVRTPPSPRSCPTWSGPALP